MARQYDNSLTVNVQYYIENYLAKKISAATDYDKLMGTAKEIRAFLSDPTTLNTPSFVIRRFIQVHKPDLLPIDKKTKEVVDVPSLSDDMNIEWDESILKKLATALASKSELRGTKITRKNWLDYLHGHGTSKREMVHRIIMTLDMPLEDAIDLFLSFDLEPPNTRNPLDLICIFCQMSPGNYTWADVEWMLNEFESRRNAKDDLEKTPIEGMTQKMYSDIKGIFEQAFPVDKSKEELVEYMLDHSAEFLQIKKKDSNKNTEKKARYLVNYSIAKQKQFDRLTKYLAILYPRYEVITANDEETKKNLARWYDGRREVIVGYNSDGTVELSSLLKAMFFHSGWGIDLDNKIVEKEISKTPNHPDYNLWHFCNNQLKHIDGIERLKYGGNDAHFYNRKDALLFSYFLISGLAEAIRAKYTPIDEAKDTYFGALRVQRSKDVSQIILQDINTLIKAGSPIDQAISEIVVLMDYIVNSSLSIDEAFAANMPSLITFFNLLLKQLGYGDLYLPAYFDRFVLLSLLSNNAHELAAFIKLPEIYDDDRMVLALPEGTSLICQNKKYIIRDVIALGNIGFTYSAEIEGTNTSATIHEIAFSDIDYKRVNGILVSEENSKFTAKDYIENKWVQMELKSLILNTEEYLCTGVSNFWEE